MTKLKDLAPKTAALLAILIVAVIATSLLATARATNQALARYTELRAIALRTNDLLLARGNRTETLLALRNAADAAHEPDLLPAIEVIAAAPNAPQARTLELAIRDEASKELSGLFARLTEQFRTITLISSLSIALIALAIVVFANYRNASLVALEREQRRKALHEHAASNLRGLIQAIPQIVWICDAHGRVRFFNDRWYAFTGQHEAGAVGDGWSAVLHPDDRARTLAAWEHSVRSGEPYEIEYRLRAADGSYRWFFGRGLPERDADGKIVQWFGTCTDIDAQHEQMESVRRVADGFAHAQLPERLPSTPRVHFDATYLAAEDVAQVGGDWYDAFEIDDERYVFSVGDVTGHGLEAAIVMSRVRQAIVALASVESDPGTILEKANRVLRVQGENMVTALCGIYDATSGRVWYASAGHPPALILGRDGAIRELHGDAPPLGIVDRIAANTLTDVLQIGDRLICYTDGIVENERNLIEGEARLRTVLGQLTPFEAQECATAVRERILGGKRGRDDIAILVITRLGLVEAVAIDALPTIASNA
ncbi:MAG: SpoIIE family protein phosphatase [bacterium]|nr:SpoIIE family protein phosphatase [bacterium]